MLETLANAVRENLETLLVAPSVMIGALFICKIWEFLFAKSCRGKRRKVTEISQRTKG